MMIQENLPNDWEYLPIRSIFTESDTRCGDNQYDLLSVTQDRGIIKQSDVDIKKDISNDDKSKYKVVLKDSIAYNKMRMWQGAVGINEIDDGIVSPAYVVINPTKEMNTKFYYYLFKTPYMISQFGKYSYGLVDDMNSLRYDDFQKIYIPIPPIEEQNKIVNFIDKKSTNIEKFIQDKTRFIELLKEQKEAIINEAVTKGLDNSVEFKDSEIEWLGEIPNHWEVKKLKFISKINNESLTESTDKEYQIQYIDIGSVDVNGLINKPQTILFGNAPSRARRIVKPNSIIISTVRTYLKAMAHFEIVDDNLIASTGFAVLDMKNDKYAKYFYYSMMSSYFINTVSIKSLGITYPAINSSDLSDIKLLVPPHYEQIQIVEYIENELNQIDKLIEKATKQIELIKEYKTSLINEAVSGKIKVC
jgi:type I restriction enzyme S subunit